MIKIKFKPIALFAAGLLWAGFAQAQESINASGGDATGSGGSVAYSVGQVAYTTINDVSGNVAQGVQQAYEVINIGIKDTKLNFSVAIFPNPTAGNLTLKLSEFSSDKLSYQLYNKEGKLIHSKQISAQQTDINMSDLPAAAYFVHIIDQENNKVQSFKIIKQ